MFDVEVATGPFGRDTEAVPARSARRATARRASNRRATARNRHTHTNASITGYIAQRPASTAGDLAEGLNLDLAEVSAHMTQLAMTGVIERASHGYRIRQATQFRRPEPVLAPLSTSVGLSKSNAPR